MPVDGRHAWRSEDGVEDAGRLTVAAGLAVAERP